ncbi:MAG: tryptophan 2,3-dioxygenase family protein [Caulobacteraceae bacterium]|nr:tryptophan 2,3-dioxygenase family protein [Caulobacteraceae bacterium]
MESQEISYGGYLKLDALLSAQAPLSNEHDELLFIVIHQAAELWMKLCLHELGGARRLIAADELSPAFKMLSRTARVQAQLIQSWEVLSTMTPADYHRLRAHLGSSSGFQSYQYRLLEFVLGARDEEMVAIHETSPLIAGQLREELARPSLYDESLRLLARRGLPVPAAVLERDVRRRHVADPGVEACWAEIYRNADRYWDLYELAEKLMDVEHHVQLWRFGHVKTVERIIGFRRGTGGTSGVAYLTNVLSKGFFPELLSVRTIL